MSRKGLRKTAALLLLALLAACGSPQERASKAVARFEQLYAARDYANARIEIRKAIAIEDDVPEYWNKLGRAELGLQNYFPAYTAYNRALELDRDDREALQAKAELAYSGGKHDEAMKLADQVLEKEPRNLRMLLVKGAALIDAKDRAGAQKLIDTMLAIDPDNAGANIILARLLFVQGDAAGSTAVLERSIARDGATLTKLTALNEVYLAEHDLGGIIRTFRRMFELDRTTVELRLDYAKALYENGRPDLALTVIDRLQRARPRDARLQKQIVDLWNMVGSDAIDIGQLRRFAAAGNKQMKLALANLAMQQGRFGEALPLLAPFIEGDKVAPANVTARIYYARAISGLGRKAEALARVNRVLAFDSTNPDALLLRVELAIDRGQYDDALTDAQILGRDNPDSAEARLALPRVYIARKDRIMADTSFVRAVNDLDHNPDVARAYTQWLLDTGRGTMAQGAAERFSEDNPRSVGGWENLGAICLRLGDRPCMKMVADALPRLHGGQKMHDRLIAAMGSFQGSQ